MCCGTGGQEQPPGEQCSRQIIQASGGRQRHRHPGPHCGVFLRRHLHYVAALMEGVIPSAVLYLFASPCRCQLYDTFSRTSEGMGCYFALAEAAIKKMYRLIIIMCSRSSL